MPLHTRWPDPHVVPSASALHCPTKPTVSQRWQSVLSLLPHALSQQTPSAAKPDAQRAPLLETAPRDRFGVQIPPVAQKFAVPQSLSALQLRGAQVLAPDPMHFPL